MARETTPPKKAKRVSAAGRQDGNYAAPVVTEPKGGPIPQYASRARDDDELRHYWTKGDGLAKWSGSPKPWTTLVAHLTEHVGVTKAKVYASRWFIEVFGYAAGSDKNRVAHGHPPRGDKVGPG